MTVVRVGEWLVDTSAPLGSGAFAEVLPASRERAGMTDVIQRAIKIYKAVGDDEHRRQALTEIKIRERLFGCPHVIDYVDAFIVEDGPYSGCVVQVMEMGDISLAGRLASERSPRRMTVSEVTDVLGDVAEALDHIHRRGFVHADLKPGNIVRCSGIWKVTDFNVTSTLIGRQGRDRGGTRAYMSPQRLAAGPGSVRREDDMWSLGVILGECLLGRLPGRPDGSREPDASMLAERIVAELERRGAHPELVALAGELLSTDPELRPNAAATALRLRVLAHRAAEEGTDLVRWSGLACSSYGNTHLEVFAAGRSDGLRHRWILQDWSTWHAMAEPCVVRAIAVGSPREYEQNLWLLDHEGGIWMNHLAVDRETYANIKDWAAWTRWPSPEGATVVDLAATNAPWAQHTLLAVDAQGGLWCRSWHAHGGWSDWWALPDTPKGLVAVRGATGGAGVGVLDSQGVLWRRPGAYAGAWHRPLPLAQPPARGFALLPDDAVVVIAGEGVELCPSGLHTGPLAPAPAGDYTAVDAASRWPGHLELVLRDREDRIMHTWAHRQDNGWWNWHPEWAEMPG